MAISSISIEEVVNRDKNVLLLDVRSPAEFAQGHIPGACNLPLFTNEERAIVGTAYKQQSRQAAIKIGLDLFGPKMRAMVEEVERLVNSLQLTVDIEKYAVDSKQLAVGKDNEPNDTTANRQLSTANYIYIYCWRGGMRSGAVAWLLGMYGFTVQRISGGYKTFRTWALQQFELSYKIKVLGGYTGSGKTELLQALQQKSETIIDLEALAHHKGSAFGSLGLPPQPTQESFENNLAVQLFQQAQKCIWLEDESQRIGRVLIPNNLWLQMRAAPVYFIDLPLEKRLQFILLHYGSFSPDELTHSIERISKRLGPQNTKAALQLLAAGNKEACFKILLQYYDKLYDKGLHSRPELGQQLHRLPGNSVGAHNVVYLTTATSYEKT